MVPQPREEKRKERISQKWVVLSEVTLENKGASSQFQGQGKGQVLKRSSFKVHGRIGVGGSKGSGRMWW